MKLNGNYKPTNFRKKLLYRGPSTFSHISFVSHNYCVQLCLTNANHVNVENYEPHKVNMSRYITCHWINWKLGKRVSKIISLFHATVTLKAGLGHSNLCAALKFSGVNLLFRFEKINSDAALWRCICTFTNKKKKKKHPKLLSKIDSLECKFCWKKNRTSSIKSAYCNGSLNF